MTTLVKIGADIRALEDLLFEMGGELTDGEAEKAIDGWLAELGDSLAEKLDSYAIVIANRQDAGEHTVVP